MDPTTAAMAAAYGFNGATQFAQGLDDAHQTPNEVRKYIGKLCLAFHHFFPIFFYFSNILKKGSSFKFMPL